MCKKLKKGLIESMDRFIEPIQDLKLFGHPVEDFEIENMTPEERKEYKKLLKLKIDKLAS